MVLCLSSAVELTVEEKRVHSLEQMNFISSPERQQMSSYMEYCQFES